jgi:dolichol-phosphate mannosyltransferase
MAVSARNLSVVIPFHNEEANVEFVLKEVREVLPEAEIVAVDDGSRDATWERIRLVDGVRGIRLSRQVGQSGAVYQGLLACTREFCGLMDGDGQNDPANFLPLLEALQNSDVDVACGYRIKREDTWSKKIASRVANWIRRKFLKDGVRDTGCSQKVFPRGAVATLVPFRGMHRYLPAFFTRAGLRLTEVPVQHRQRHAGTSKYDNWSRAVSGIHDLIGVRWLLRRRITVCNAEMVEPSANAANRTNHTNRANAA